MLGVLCLLCLNYLESKAKTEICHLRLNEEPGTFLESVSFPVALEQGPKELVCVLKQREYKREHFIVFGFKQKVYSKIKNPKSLVLVFQYNDLKYQNS
jgi:hypothetical protein